MKFAFMLCDEDSTGSITHHELVLILRANHMAKTEAEVTRKAETIIAQCDKRNDGTITFDEFVVVSRKFPNILFPRQSMIWIFDLLYNIIICVHSLDVKIVIIMNIWLTYNKRCNKTCFLLQLRLDAIWYRLSALLILSYLPRGNSHTSLSKPQQPTRRPH